MSGNLRHSAVRPSNFFLEGGGAEIEGKLLWLKIGCGALDLAFFSECVAKNISKHEDSPLFISEEQMCNNWFL